MSSLPLTYTVYSGALFNLLLVRDMGTMALSLSACTGVQFSDTPGYKFDNPPEKLNSVVDARQYRFNLNALNGYIATYDIAAKTLKPLRTAYPTGGVPPGKINS